MIYNINTLQRLASTGTGEELKSYTDVYLKQSLANLGQRFSIRGDGVTNGSFYMYELMPEKLKSPDEDSFSYGGDLYGAYMSGVVKKDESTEQVNIVLTAYEDGVELAHVDLSADDYAILDSDVYSYGEKVASSTNKAPIAYYGSGGLISMPDDRTLKTAMKSLSYDGTLLDISFNNYDEDYSRLNDAVRIGKYEDDVIMTFISARPILSNKIVNYDILSYKVNINNGSVDSMWNTIMSSDGPVMSGDNKYDWTGQTIVDDLLQASGDEYELIGSYTATWNDVTNNLACDSDVHGNDIVEANVLQWNESCAIELPLFRNIYNQDVYFSVNDNLQLKKRLVAKIFYDLYINRVEESEEHSTVYEPFVIIAPYDYEFIYTCNSVNPAQIYSASRSITEESTIDPLSEIWKVTGEGNNGVREQLLICSSSKVSDSSEDIYSVWNYYVTYDKDDIVNDISVVRVYVMPYINDDGYWNINNVDTSIYARGKNGGQPSIIISYSDIDDGHQGPHILSTLNSYELENLDWEIAYYQARPLDTSTAIGSGASHMMRTYMPVHISTAYMADNLVTFLENAIVMDIASVRNEDFSQSTTTKPFSDPSELGENATITTFWALTKDEHQDYVFSYVKQPATSWAVDFNYLTDAEAIIRYYMQLGTEPDKYRHSWLVYDEVSAQLKNQPYTVSIARAFPVLMNRRADSIGDIFAVNGPSGESYNYSNNLNFMLGFYDNVEFSGSYISNIPDENNGRFFGFDDNDHVTTIPALRTPNVTGTEALLSYDYYPVMCADPLSQDDSSYNSLIPTLELKETFLRNVNVFNRYNILSPDANGNIFYSYIGGTYDNDDKSILHIGTSSENINLGLKTLTTEAERKKFKTQHEIDVDFATIVLNGDVVIPKAVWVKMEQEGHPEHVMYSTLYELAYIFSELPDPKQSIEEAEDDKMLSVITQVSDAIDDIGGGVSLAGKTVNTAYVNLNWFVNDILKLAGDGLSIIGEPERIYESHSQSGVSYFLKLTTDIYDAAELAYEETGAYYVKTNPLSVSYEQTLDGIVHLNIREDVTTHSTAYSIYDGGELQYED